MKIALVFPRYKYPSGELPLGIGYIASYIRNKTNHEVDIMDTTFKKDPDEYIKSVFKKTKYDIVGISIMTSMMKDGFKVASIVKKINPDTFVIMGGPHPTVLPKETLENENIDAVCIGEGEHTFLEIIKKKERNKNLIKNLKGVKGIWYKENGKIIKNLPREPVKDLDKLPSPAWDLFPMEQYIEAWYQFDTVGEFTSISIIASRGCPYKCTYCQPTLNALFGKRLRKRSPSNIIKELRELKERYNINAFSFSDDTFVIDKKWVLDFCDKFIKSKLNLAWQCNVRANLVDEELLSKMKEAGLVRIGIGIESASQRVLDEVYNKGITMEQVKKALAIAKRLKLKVHGYFMIGAPTETLEEIKTSIRFARKSDIDTVTFNVTTPLPHTYLYEKSKELIAKNFEEFDYYKIPVYKGKSVLPNSKLNHLRKIAYLQFHLSPKRILTTIKSFSTPMNIKKTFLKLRRF